MDVNTWAARKLEQIELEMAYTSWEQSCKDPLLPAEHDERACRRQAGHEDYHAAGFSANGTLVLWATVTGNTGSYQVVANGGTVIAP